MGKITDIQENKGKEQDRVYVFIDNSYCFSVRSRTWKSFSLQVGDNADCEELKKKEKFIWKDIYGKESWEKEKVRLNYVHRWIEKYIPHVKVRITGFGANSTEFIEGHPEEKGEPDIQILLDGTDTVVLFLEVTGTEFKKGNDYWIRPDKIDYMQKHQDKDIWVALHYKNPVKIIWIQPIMDKEYKYVVKNLKGADEHFVIFNDKSPEVKSSQEFKGYLDLKVSNLL